MTTPSYVLAVDRGTRSTRAILFDRDGRPAATAQREQRQFCPAGGWVGHDPEDIWRDTVAIIGITNQRESSILRDRRTNACRRLTDGWREAVRCVRSCQG